MKVLFLSNGRVGHLVYSYLTTRDLDLYSWTVVGAKPPDAAWLSEHHFDICVSALYTHILEPDFIRVFPKGVVNLHPSLLPYCRGASPAFWAMAYGLPAGVTIHYIDEGIDTGNIIAQQFVRYYPNTICRDLYDHCLYSGVELFKSVWQSIEAGTNRSVPQPNHRATFHRVKELPGPFVFDLTAEEIQNEYGKRD